MKTVWIIGGLWPETTSEFYLDVMFSCQEEKSESMPWIVIASVALPYKIEENAIANNCWFELILPFLLKEARRLEKSGVDFIVLPCNSLHLFIEDIRKSVSIPVLSIVEETIKYIQKKGYWTVGIVSTSATIENKLYENAFEKSNIHYKTPNPYDQAKMWKFIMNLVRWQQNNRDREEFINIIWKFEQQWVDAVALACTDLQLLIPTNKNIIIFDTMKILSQSTVKKLLN